MDGRPGDNDDFYDALGSLHSLVLAVASVEAFMQEVAGLAAAAVEVGIACGITTRYDHNPMTIAASDQRAALVDEEQYGAGQGPCLTALTTGLVIEVVDQEADHRWEVYREAALSLGVRCSLSLPLIADGASVGALNLYGFDAPGGFGPESRRRAEVFAGQASTALTLALRFTDQEVRSRQLAEALASRSVIDQALGILMVEQRCDSRTAFALLRRRSQGANQKLREVASDLVERATGHQITGSSPFQEPGDTASP